MKRRFFEYFSKFEIGLWISSVAVIVLSYTLSGNDQWMYMLTSLIGVTSLIFIAKGNVTGQVMMVVFCLLYGVISYSYRYYGEMITYLGMSMPISIVSVVTWMRHPFEGRKSEVKVSSLNWKDYAVICVVGVIATAGFGWLLMLLKTANLIFSILSVFTSVVAVLLSMRRSPLYALGYALNDVVLIVLWLMASAENSDYLGMVFCFLAFLANDLYGFVSWKRMERRQRSKIKGL
ncbi:MAG: nicotinamide mononucleotide transporter [Clostridia bacterium]|nr:nicotinamide mononucleotide transporter [Clostridia bacterium]